MKNIKQRLNNIEAHIGGNNIPSSLNEFIEEWKSLDDITKAIFEEGARNESFYKWFVIGDTSQGISKEQVYSRTMVKYLLDSGMVNRQVFDRANYQEITSNLHSRIIKNGI